MKHLLHHYSWLIHRFWPSLLCYLLLWAGVCLTVWLSPKWLNTDDLAYSVHLWLPLAGAVFLIRALMEDRAAGTGTFWRTRPPRWPAVWGSQFLFMLTVALPPLLCWLANGWLLHNTAAQWEASLAEIILILGPLAALAAVATFARGWYTFFIGVAAFAVCWLGGFWTLTLAGDGRWMTSNAGHVLRIRLALLLLAAPGAICLAVWMAGMRSGKRLLRGSVLAALLTGGPFVLSHFLGVLPPAWKTHTRLTIAPADRSISDAQRMGDVALSGIPPGCVAVVTENDCQVTAPYTRPPSRAGRPPFGYSAQELSSLAAFSPLLPADTRWYHNGPPPPDKGLMKLPRFARGPLVLSGSMEGMIVRPEAILDVPLKQGTVTRNGLQVILRDIRPLDNGNYLRLVAEIRRSSTLGTIILPDGTSMDAYREASIMAILHLKRHGIALFAGSTGDRSFFRSWQTQGHLWNAGVSMPAAESIQGIHWDQTTLDETRLLFCVLRQESKFTAEPDGSAISLAPPTTEDGIQTQITLWKQAKSDIGRRDPEGVLLSLGEPALRQLIAVSWGGDRFPDFAAKLFADSPGLLPEAARRDERWVEAALREKITDPARQAALVLLRETPGRLRTGVVAAAAAVAAPTDYPALVRQAGMFRDDPGQSSPLWAELRQLPGLDWKSLARRAWMSHVAMGLKPSPGLRFSAALAGEVRALTGTVPGAEATVQSTPLRLDSRWVSEGFSRNELQDLVRLIPELPLESENRDDWMQANAARLRWNDTLQKYQIQN